MIQFLIGAIFLTLCGLLFSFALAQETSPLAQPLSTPTSVEYILPYPGLLPDHPLYIFKQLRDRILTVFIFNPVRKVEFHILLSDKKINMGIFLMQKNKFDLALQTIKESLDCLKIAREYLDDFSSSQTAEKANLQERLNKSILKHVEEIRKLILTSLPEERTQLEALLVQIEPLRP